MARSELARQWEELLDRSLKFICKRAARREVQAILDEVVDHSWPLTSTLCLTPGHAPDCECATL